MAPRRAEYRPRSRSRAANRQPRIDKCLSPRYQYDDGDYFDFDNGINGPELNINPYQSWKTAVRLIRKRMSVLAVIIYFLLVRYFAMSFPHGIFRSSAMYGIELDSIGSRILFTIQQHIWTVIPLLWGYQSVSKVVYTQILFLNTLILSVLIKEAYMRYVSAVIITSSLFMLMGKFVDSPAWKHFFSLPRKASNWLMTIVCIKLAMDTKTLTGLS